MGVSMNKNKRNQCNPLIFILMMVSIFSVFLFSQNNQLSYLSQKLLLENSLRERVDTALGKLLGDIKYVVDVNIEIDFVYLDKDGKNVRTSIEQKKQSYSEVSTKSTDDMDNNKAKVDDVSMPLPGFETPESLVKETAPEAEDILTQNVQERSGTPKKIYVEHSSGIRVPVVKSQEIKIILEDGISPEVIENVREVASVAAHYDRSRGDVLSIMTSEFNRKTKKKSNEDVILKNIAEKLSNLEERQQRAELDAKLEKQRRFEKYTMKQDSIRISKLQKQIDDLKNERNKPEISETEEKIVIEETDEREQELELLRKQLTESNARLAELDKGVMETELPSRFSGKDFAIWALLLFIALLLVFMIVLLLKNRTRPPVQPANYSQIENTVPVAKTSSQKIGNQSPEVNEDYDRPEKPELRKVKKISEEEISQQKEEVKGLKQSVISMSIGNSTKGVDIINSWLETDEESSEEEGDV